MSGGFRAYYLCKIMYLGDRYHGLQRQPGLDTVEGRIITAMRECGYLPPEESVYGKDFVPFYMAGRTDRGVHARGMVAGFFCLKRDFHPIRVNRCLPEDICIWAYSKICNFSGGDSEIIDRILTDNTPDYGAISEKISGIGNSIVKMGRAPPGPDEIMEKTKRPFRGSDLFILLSHKIIHPRYDAVGRRYKYFLPVEGTGLDTRAIISVLPLFEGTHEFKNLAKSEKNRIRKTVRTIDKIDYSLRNGILILDFRAKSFLWQQIRRIVGALKLVGYGRWGEEEIKDILNTSGNDKNVRKISPASPDGLVLWDVYYPEGIKFEKCTASVKRMGKNLKGMLLKYKMRYTLCGGFLDDFGV